MSSRSLKTSKQLSCLQNTVQTWKWTILTPKSVKKLPECALNPRIVHITWNTCYNYVVWAQFTFFWYITAQLQSFYMFLATCENTVCEKGWLTSMDLYLCTMWLHAFCLKIFFLTVFSVVVYGPSVWNKRIHSFIHSSRQCPVTGYLLAGQKIRLFISVSAHPSCNQPGVIQWKPNIL